MKQLAIFEIPLHSAFGSVQLCVLLTTLSELTKEESKVVVDTDVVDSNENERYPLQHFSDNLDAFVPSCSY